MPAISANGPYTPNPLTNELEMYSDAPVFSRANDIGIMAAINTILSQLMVL